MSNQRPPLQIPVTRTQYQPVAPQTIPTPSVKTPTIKPLSPAQQQAAQQVRAGLEGRVGGKGLEKLITSIAKGLATIENTVDDAYYGNPLRPGIIKLPGTKTKINGIKPLVEEVSKVDLCNIVTYVLSNTKLSSLPGANTVVGKKLGMLQDKAKKLVISIDDGTLTNKVISKEKLTVIRSTINEIDGLIDNDLVAVMPQLANAKNYIYDVAGTLNSYTDLNTIPNADVQRLLTKIRNVQSTMYSIANMQTVQDVANVLNNTTNLNIAEQIDRLQKLINPAQLLPAFRKIATVLRSINQIALKVLKYIRVLQVVNKALAVIARVLDVIVKIISFIPIPNIITIVTITQKFSDALQSARKFIDKVQKRVSEIFTLIDLIYSFILGLVGKIDELLGYINIIIFNLEACAATTDSPIIASLKDAVSRTNNTKNQLTQFTATYAKAQASKTNKERTYNGYTLRIEEEELVDEGIKYKRRKAIALDSRGVLVAETQLTFATDLDILYQELILILQNKGLISDIGITGLEILGTPSELAPSDADIYNSVGLVDENEIVGINAEVSLEVTNFISGLKKKGRRFQRRIRQLTAKYATDSAKALKQSVKDGSYKGASSLASTTAANVSKRSQVSEGAPDTEKRLTEKEREKWLLILSSAATPPPLKVKAAEILAKDMAKANE